MYFPLKQQQPPTTLTVYLLNIPTTHPCPRKPHSFYLSYGINPSSILDHRTANPLQPSIFVKICATACYQFSRTRGPDITHWLFTPSYQPSPPSTIHFVLTKIPNSTPKIIAFLHPTP